MSKTSAKVKNAYAQRNYDRINLIVPKGDKEKILEHATQQGDNGLNGFIKRAIAETMARDAEKT